MILDAFLKGKVTILQFCEFYIIAIVKCKISYVCFLSENENFFILRVFLVPKLHILFMRKIV